MSLAQGVVGLERRIRPRLRSAVSLQAAAWKVDGDGEQPLRPAIRSSRPSMLTIVFLAERVCGETSPVVSANILHIQRRVLVALADRLTSRRMADSRSPLPLHRSPALTPHPPP